MIGNSVGVGDMKESDHRLSTGGLCQGGLHVNLV